MSSNKGGLIDPISTDSIDLHFQPSSLYFNQTSLQFANWSEQELIAAIQNGHRHSDRMLAALFKGNLPAIIKMAEKHQSLKEAFFNHDDLLQEAFIVVAQNVNRFNPALGKSFIQFIYWPIKDSWKRIINYHHAYMPIEEMDDATDDDGGFPSCDHDSSIQRSELPAAAEKVFRELPTPVQTILLMFFKDNLTQSQIAEILHISQQAISKTLKLSLVKMRQRLDQSQISYDELSQWSFQCDVRIN